MRYEKGVCRICCFHLLPQQNLELRLGVLFLAVKRAGRTTWTTNGKR
jgi:hypothetical protein